MITLDENYRIETEANNFILKYERPTGEINKKTGKEMVSSGEWYYGKLEHALDKYLNEALKPSKYIQDLKTRLSEIARVITIINL